MRGEQLFEEEIPAHASAIRRQRVGNITTGLGHAGFLNGGPETRGQTVRISAEPSEPRKTPKAVEDEVLFVGNDGEPLTAIRRGGDALSDEKHEDTYIAAIITRFGIRPILNQPDIDTAHAAQERARSEDEPALIYGIGGDSLADSKSEGTMWLSGGGIVSPDGAGLFDIREVEINAG